MANARSSNIGPRLTNAQIIAGYLYLPFYLVLLSLVLHYVSDALGLGLTALQLNACWFVLNALAVWLIFHNFLLRSFRNIRFWEFVQAVILGFVFYYAGTWVFRFLIDLLNIRIVSFNDQTVQSFASDNFTVTAICSVVIAPLVEETLVRGLIFGSIRPKSRAAAYGASILFFSLMHVWSYVPTEGLVPVLLAAVQYIPASVALGWTYEKANTVWAPIAVHMVINAIAMSLI